MQKEARERVYPGLAEGFEGRRKASSGRERLVGRGRSLKRTAPGPILSPGYSSGSGYLCSGVPAWGKGPRKTQTSCLSPAICPSLGSPLQKGVGEASCFGDAATSSMKTSMPAPSTPAPRGVSLLNIPKPFYIDDASQTSHVAHHINYLFPSQFLRRQNPFKLL